MNLQRNLSLLSKLPQFWSWHRLGWPRLLPINLTINATYNCNSRCRTCNVWRQKTREFSLNEWEKTFSNIGKGQIYWLIISGGEPFLRPDILSLVKIAYDKLSPAIINIPTNGLLYNRIPKVVEKIAEYCSNSQIIINLSLDEIAEKHDKIRGVKGNFKKAILTYESLKVIKSPNLTVGIHAVISKYNVKRFPKIADYFINLGPDQYITEIAERRAELRTLRSDITPSTEEYIGAINYLLEKINKIKFTGMARFTESFRLEYYDLVKNTLKTKAQMVPCYSGFASGQISADGEIWPCCVRAINIGNLRDFNYDFKTIWFGGKADEARKDIKGNNCSCPLASAKYTDMLINPLSLFRVGRNFFKLK